jgi:NAD(P) transhydrogenase subunit alpha
MAPQASQMYSRNITSFLLALLKDGNLNIDTKDDLIRGPLVINRGEVVHQGTKVALGGAPAK